MVNLWAGGHGQVFGQQAVYEKCNDLSAIPQLLELLDKEGCTVTIDALGCLKDLAATVTNK